MYRPGPLGASCPKGPGLESYFERFALAIQSRVSQGACSPGKNQDPRTATPSWAVAGDRNSLSRVNVKDPSLANWPTLNHAILKNIVPDFPLINKSFNLCYAGNDLRARLCILAQMGHMVVDGYLPGSRRQGPNGVHSTYRGINRNVPPSP